MEVTSPEQRVKSANHLEDCDAMLGCDTVTTQVDTNPDTALIWANELSSPAKLPAMLDDVRKRALLVETIDAPFISNSVLATLSSEEKQRRIETVARLVSSFMPDVQDANARASIALRLWVGCMTAAKTIANETRAGPNTREIRTTIFAAIDSISARDPLYCAGVEAGPAFKALRLQPFSLEGVPKESPVRKFAESNDRPSDVLTDFVQGRRRILFNFWHHGKQVDNLGELAEKWGYKSGAGNFNKFVNELVTEKRLKRYQKNDKVYLEITWRGGLAILPLILPFVLMIFFLLVSFMLIAETIPSITGIGPLSTWTILTIGLVLLVFSAFGLALVYRMEAFLLKPQ
jgi:hypothetical protein